MEIWIATGNKGKVKEYEALFKNLLGSSESLILKTQSDIPGFSPRPEDGKTFEDNARIKARTLRAIKDKHWVFGEDSGLEVEGLGGLPGIHSARYAGPKASDSENVAKLLKMITIRSAQQRQAQFKASLVVYNPQGEEWVFSGSLKGEISKAPKGQMGFGYDPVFIPEGETQTLAELGPAYKVTKSHRTQAFQAFAKRFQEFVKTL